MWTVWWVWVVAGFLLGILEVFTPGFIFLGFAVGAVLTGAVVGVGLAPASFPQLLLIFAALSVLAWFGMRRLAGVRQGQVTISQKDVNDN
jgi:membrane protein implicated in regulation of membrane protease activity